MHNDKTTQQHYPTKRAVNEGGVPSSLVTPVKALAEAPASVTLLAPTLGCTAPCSHPTGAYRGLITNTQAGNTRGARLPDPVLMPVTFTKPVLPKR